MLSKTSTSRPVPRKAEKGTKKPPTTRNKRRPTTKVPLPHPNMTPTSGRVYKVDIKSWHVGGGGLHNVGVTIRKGTKTDTDTVGDSSRQFIVLKAAALDRLLGRDCDCLSLSFGFEWGVYALSASKAIFRARTYNCNLFSPVMMITWIMKLGGNRPPGDNPLLFSISGTGSFICPVA